MKYIEAAVPLPVQGTFHYLIEATIAEQLHVGSVVEVPFGRQSTHAFILGFTDETDLVPAKIKSVEKVLSHDPVLTPSMLEFIQWISEYYCHPLGEVLSCALPRVVWEVKNRRKANEEKITDANPPLQLTQEQKSVLESIASQADLKPILLQGITGSGKTEVYLQVLEKVLAEGKTAIILVPEIALTPQLLNRFSSRFPGLVSILHSDLTPNERYYHWQNLRSGKTKIALGARSAIFAPLENLGLIVVDEEHEPSYKQEDGVHYHARDCAIVRAKQAKAKVILGTATPSVETYYNAKSGKYHHLELKSRVNQNPLPDIEIVDLKDRNGWYSEKVPWITKRLVYEVEKTLSEKKQALLYLNRLGYAHFLYCKDCGHCWKCKSCDVSLTLYQNPPLLKCHYCNTTKHVPQTCEACMGYELHSMGVGTEQIQHELTQMFPQAKIARLDRSQIKTRKQLEALIESVNNHEVDILIGTQMVAKGHDFANVALVGILLADSSLNIPDFRAFERTYQILTQVSGRAGRAKAKGKVILQTLNPEHPVIQMACQGKVESFYELELLTRRNHFFPPYQRMVLLRLRHTNPQRVQDFSKQLAHKIKATFQDQVVLLGPAQAPIAKINKYFRWQILLKAASSQKIKEIVALANQWAKAQKSAVQMQYDVDPTSTV